MRVAEGHKELRFTRARQAAGFWVAAAVLLVAAVIIFHVARYRAENERLPHPAWGLIPLALSLPVIRLAIRCTRHAYLILSPIGVEVFPLFRPETGMQVVPWGQIDAMEIDDRRLTLHFNQERTAGLHLTLSPMARPQRVLLEKALRGRLS